MTIQRHPSYHGRFMRAARLEPVDCTPVWMMRQAGRYQAEYQALREKVSFLELCKTPELCAEVMLRSVDQLGVDAAILFADLLLIFEPMGLKLEYLPNHGPKLSPPLRSAEDLSRFHELFDLEPLSYVADAVSATRAGLDENVPLIGFAGAPFTLAAYAIEGGASRHFIHTKKWLYTDPAGFDRLLGKIVRSAARYLNMQIDAGAQAVQLFDSWVGHLGTDVYREHILPATRTLIDSLPDDIPVIHFGTGNPALLPLMARAGGTVIGVDWRVDLPTAWNTIGHDRAVQGNLDPTVLLTNPEVIARETQKIVDQVDGRAGHIFNLGHGILPQTPVENARALVEAVHEQTRR
jgi:uroporphyrinogen decarboxylase